MNISVLLTFTFSFILSFLTVGLALPTGSAYTPVAPTPLNPRYGTFGFDYELVCPTARGKPLVNVNADQCFRRFRTYCDGTGAMKNQFFGVTRPGSQICNSSVCRCQPRAGVALPGFADPSPEEIGWAMNMHGAGGASDGGVYINAMPSFDGKRDVDEDDTLDTEGSKIGSGELSSDSRST